MTEVADVAANKERRHLAGMHYFIIPNMKVKSVYESGDEKGKRVAICNRVPLSLSAER